ncbi:cardiolipin synthase [soil metagenome]
MRGFTGEMFHWWPAFLFLFTAIFQVVGFYCAVKAVLISRTPQAAIGWALALIVFPYLAIPLFLVFGESRFSGYVAATQKSDYLEVGENRSEKLDAELGRAQDALRGFEAHLPGKYADCEKIALRLRGLPATTGNRVRLLVNGEETFPAIFEAIRKAENYVIVQFFIVRDDVVGRQLHRLLLEARLRGVRCWLLFDGVGSAKKITKAYIEELRTAGVSVQSFVTNRQFGRHFQINFRNHRKLVVVDGKIGFLGGLNVGDDYRGLGFLGPWRDTHVQIEGPAVIAVQVSFLEDWNYVAGDVPELPAEPRVYGQQIVMPFASGPTENWNITPAVFCQIIHDAQKRLWIASPYFVPDYALKSALAHAALRGVDVRIILPQNADHLLPWLSSFTNYPFMRTAGVRIWRYQPGFMHQKMLLADDDIAIVGSVNLDYRSFMLNFELSTVVYDRSFAIQVEKMLEADFALSLPEDLGKYENGSLWFRLKCRLAGLMSPEQ